MARKPCRNGFHAQSNADDARRDIILALIEKKKDTFQKRSRYVAWLSEFGTLKLNSFDLRMVTSVDNQLSLRQQNGKDGSCDFSRRNRPMRALPRHERSSY
jgi:hypothetical protein